MKPIIIAAGGTGGHFFPAEALASVLMQRGERVVLMTDARSGGLASPVFAKTERHVLAGAGLSGRGFGKMLQGVVALWRGTMQARKILVDIKPGAIVAFGGYPAIAPVMAARFLKPRPFIVLHEQNAVLGRANRFLGLFSDLLALSFETVTKLPRGKHTANIGNPVRPAIAALHGGGYQPPDATIKVLVLGGSLGARIFGTLIPEALALMPEYLRVRLNVTQQCRDDDLAAAQTIFDAASIKVTLSPFFTDVASLIGKSHLVIARSGASTVAELTVAGRPAIFIPLPSAIDDHQRANADAVADHGGAWRLDQAGLTPQILANRIEALLNSPEDLSAAAANAALIGRPAAAEALADLVTGAMAGVVS